MLRIDATVDDKGGSPVAEQILGSWEPDAGSIKFFRSSANFVFRFRRAGVPYFLRFAHSSERRRDDIDTEMSVVASLDRQGVRVAAPLPGPGGRFVTTAETEFGTFHGVVLVALQGRTLDIDELIPPQFHAWGAGLGRLHRGMTMLPTETVSARRSWQDDLAFAAVYIPHDRPAVRYELEQLSRQLSILPVELEHFGLIHFDFELDNLVWDEAGLGVLDFDDCARYWYAADIAFALGDLFERGYDPRNRSLQEFLRGYETERPLDSDLAAALPTFLRLADLLRYARVRRAADLSDSVPQPQWMLELRRKLASRLGSYEASLAAKWRPGQR